MNNDQNNIFSNMSTNNNTNGVTPGINNQSIPNTPTVASTSSVDNATTLNSVSQNSTETEMKIGSPGPFDIGFDSNNNVQPINSDLKPNNNTNSQMETNQIVNNTVTPTQSNIEQSQINTTPNVIVGNNVP